MTMLNVYDMNRKKSAVLQNAYDITEVRELNKIYSLTFSIPSTDEKTQYIQPFHYVRYGDDGELYRIIKSDLSDSDMPVLTVTCEHVIAVLVDDLLFGAIQYGGGTIKTSQVISFLLSKQTTKNWVLNECDFDRRFEYLWEQENILNAIYSIPKEFTKAYKWDFDTLSYPWKLSLKTIDETVHPEYYIRAKRNLLSSGTAQDFAGVCTRIYPLGYGEGVNQLGISEINNGLPYLQSPDTIIAQYGIKEKVLVDRRFENAEALKEYAQTMLDAMQTPSMSRTFDVIDLYPLTSQNIDNADVGKICKMTDDGTIAYVTKTTRVLDDPGNLQIELSTKATDVASTVADLADRVRIESVYAQGATQLYQHSKDANATPSKGMVMSLYFPSEMRQINKVLMRLKLGKFRSYSQTTSSNGGFDQTYTIAAQSQTYSVDAKEQTYSVGEQSQTYSVDSQKQTYSVKEQSQTYSVDASEKTYSVAEQSQTYSVDTQKKTYTVKEQSQTYSVDASEKTYSVAEQSQTYSVETQKKIYSVKEQSQTYSVDASSKTITATFNKTATTDMTADSNQNLTTSGAGGATGSTSTDGGGTINVSLSGTASETENANWSPYVSNNYGSSNLDVSSTLDDGSTSWASDHSHNLWAYTGEVTPPASADYKHSHAINYTGGALGAGGHSHTFTTNGHSHSFSVYKLKHTHSVPITVKSNTDGQVGFAHKHTFSIGNHSHTLNIKHQHKYNLSHSHSIEIPGHSHTIKIPAHSHEIEIPGHSHTIKIPAHSHKISIPGHSHTIKIPAHSHEIEIPGHSHTIKIPGHSHTITIPGHSHKITIPGHSHEITIPGHSHKITIPGHSHKITIPTHSHNITIPGHSHTVTIPAHSHDIHAGIFESGNPTSFDIYIKGIKKATISATNYEGDITTWLLNEDNQIPRDSWIDVEIRPNDLAYVQSSVFVQGFVQSRGGGNY